MSLRAISRGAVGRKTFPDVLPIIIYLLALPLGVHRLFMPVSGVDIPVCWNCGFTYHFRCARRTDGNPRKHHVLRGAR